MAGSSELLSLFGVSGGFTPGASFAGGVLIGLSACLLLATLGRVAGISGIVGRLFTARGADRAWRWLFLIGLLGGAWVAHSMSLGPTVTARVVVSPQWLAFGGLLVGWGTARGNGCTSGHGVCGLGLRTQRAIVATTVFVGTAVLTVLVLHQLARGAA